MDDLEDKQQRMENVATRYVIHGKCPDGGDDIEIVNSQMEILASVMKNNSYNTCEQWPCHLKFLVAGVTGAGKSTLLNSILGKKLAEEGAGTDPCTNKLKEYKKLNVIPGVSVSLVDSPGLQDITEREDDYIRAMKTKSLEINLVLYCNQVNVRLTKSDKETIIKLTQAFGEEFWKYVVIVLTFSNHLCDGTDRTDPPEPSDDASDEEWNSYHKRKFEHRLAKRKDDFKHFLKTRIPISHHIVDNMLFVPAGTYKRSPNNSKPFVLPDREHWLRTMLETCCQKVIDNKFATLEYVSNNRFHLAVIINNEIEETKENVERSTPSIEESKQDQENLIETDQDHARPTCLQYNDQATSAKDALEALGYKVLYFHNLHKDSIERLLQVLFESKDDCEANLLSFALILFSKGKTPHIYDSSNDEVHFEKIFNHFKHVNIPKYLFFHLQLTKRSTLPIQLPRVPHNSNTLAVCLQPSAESLNCVSAVAEVFTNAINGVSTGDPIAKAFKIIKTRCYNGVIDILDCKHVPQIALSPFYIPTGRNDQFKEFCFSKWCKIRHRTVDVVLDTKDDMMSLLNKARIAKIATASTSLVVGGGLTIAGLALLPFTFGASIGLTLAGAGIGAASTISGTTAYFVTKGMNYSRFKFAQRHIQVDQQFSLNLQQAIETYNEERTQSYIASIVEGADVVGAGARVGLSVAKGVVVGASEGAVVAARVGGRAVGGVLGGLTLVFTVPLDIYSIARNSYELSKSKDKSGKFEKDEDCQYLIKTGKSLLSDFFRVVNENCFKIEGKCDTFNTDSGCTLHISDSTCKAGVTCDISVDTILSGPIKLPQRGVTLASAIYHITVDNEKILKPVYVEIEHCVADFNTSRMCFANIEFDLEARSFVLKTLDSARGRFNDNTGSIEIKETCYLCIVLSHDDNVCIQKTLKYAEVGFYTKVCTNFWKRTIVFAKCLKAHELFALSNASNPITQFGERNPFHFTRPVVELKKLKERTSVQGWSFFPDDSNCDEIYKYDIDTMEFTDIPNLPTITVNITMYEDHNDVSVLSYQVPLDGTDLTIKFDLEQES